MPLFINILFIFIYFGKSENEQLDAEFWPTEGMPCTVADAKWYPVKDGLHDFLYCNWMDRVYARQRCGLFLNGQRKVFDKISQQCIAPKGDDESRLPNVETSSGDKLEFDSPKKDNCQTDEQCPENAKCLSNICECQNGFVTVNHMCWKVIQPNGVCIFDEQCSAAWPGTKCHQGTCVCSNETVRVNTSSGVLCTIPDRCPLGDQFAAISKSADRSNQCQTCNQLSANASLYECIHAENFSHPICCPNKAFTCMQPQLSGSGQLVLRRFAYNSVTDTCQEFQFQGGSMVNSNVFHTKLQCDNYCRRDCLRGNPELKNGRAISCATDSQCSNEYICYKRDNVDKGLCCPSSENICNAISGSELISNDQQDIMDSEINDVNDKYFPSVRYYYSPKEKQCKTFLYRGLGGNLNNFLTMEQCQNFCAAAVCPRGLKAAIDSETNRWIRCRIDGQCPSGFACQNGSCCGSRKNEKPPTVSAKCRGNGSTAEIIGATQTVPCSLGQQLGCKPPYTCSYASINATEGICCLVPPESIVCPIGMRKAWTDDGHYHLQCSPLHLSSCSRGAVCVYNELYGIYYCCLITAEECPNGRAPYYAEPLSKAALNCTSNCPVGFTCSESPASSQKICCSEHPLVKQCLIGKALINRDGVPYACDSKFQCPPGYYCVTTTREGSICCPRADQICAMDVDFGSRCAPGLETLQVYFDPVLRACRTFVYRGCGGNDNRFADLDQCHAFCQLSTICQHGQPYMAENSVARMRRNGTVACDQCPEGYKCTAVALNQSYCCLSPEKVCKLEKSNGIPCDDVVRDVSEYKRVWYFDFNSQICLPMSYSGCGGNANRFHSLEKCEQFCHPTSCPSDGKPLKDANQLVYQCSNDKDCNFGYECIRPNSGNSICCPSDGKTAAQICPGATSGPMSRNLATRCNGQSDQCSLGYVCVYNSNLANYYCCPDAQQQSRSLISSGNDVACPGNTPPYADPYTNTVRVCSPYLRFSCPSNYDCVYNYQLSRYQCCVLSQTSTNSGKDWAYRMACPVNMEPYFYPNGRPVICQPTSLSDTCPTPSICQYSPLYWQFICCVPGIQQQSFFAASDPAEKFAHDFAYVPTDKKVLNLAMNFTRENKTFESKMLP